MKVFGEFLAIGLVYLLGLTTGVPIGILLAEFSERMANRISEWITRKWLSR